MSLPRLTKEIIQGWQKEPESTGKQPHQGEVWIRYLVLMTFCLELIDEIDEERSANEHTESQVEGFFRA